MRYRPKAILPQTPRGSPKLMRLPTNTTLRPVHSGEERRIRTRASLLPSSCVHTLYPQSPSAFPTAKLLEASPVRDVYFVAGNNDLPLESAAPEGLAYFNLFFDDVQKRIDETKSNVQLHNLTRCYAANGGPASTCSADIAGTPYRMIGFPSYSFKNNENGSQDNPDLQSVQFEMFRGLVEEGRQAGKKILIVTHIPELDDPYYLAQGRYAAKSPNPPIDTGTANPRSPWSTWNVNTELLDAWRNVTASESVVGILAGHLHDAHNQSFVSTR